MQKKENGTLIDFFKKSPLPEIELDLKRDKDRGRELDFFGKGFEEKIKKEKK